jgi:hypothetical protein
MADATTFVARDETTGRRYPLFLERFLVILVFIALWFLIPTVRETSDVLAFCGLPIALVMLAELVGRAIQTIRSDS